MQLLRCFEWFYCVIRVLLCIG